jgi:hypothetical protein
MKHIKDNIWIITLLIVSIIPIVLKLFKVIDIEWIIILMPLIGTKITIIVSIIWVTVGLIVEELNKLGEDE